uniref:C3H1-type domain-containing protein n=1 Tax=Arion vulgaris TaxID=1028688 RepID=A0A0B7A1V9_9EUPU
MEGESQVPSAGEVSSATEAAEYLKQSSSDKFESEEDISKSVGPKIHSNLLCNESDVIDGNGDYIPVEASLKSEDNHSWGHLKDNNMHYLREDHVSKLSTFSSAQNENSEPFTADRESSSLSEFRVVTTDPLENNLGETLPKVQSSLTEAAIGPSEEREDISDEELEPDIWAAEDAQKDNTESTYLGSTVKALEINETPADTNSASYHNDIRQSPCDDRDPIDMKFKDAEEKNDAGSRDDHQQSRGPNEDLETVSDDELSEAVMTGDLHVESAFKLIEGGEQVSSSEDEGPASPDNTYAAPQQELPQVDNIASKLIVEGSEFSYGNISSPDLGFKTDVSMSQLRADHPGFLSMPLAPLEAEPISDGEDLDHADGSTVDVEDGEAGEIHSPAHRSPVSFPEQTSAALLGEVEPISADESSDTDGELPSGDEDSLSKTDIGGINPNNNFLESIDSDEEGDLGPALSSHKLQSVNRKRSAGEYRETISDEDERLPVGRNRPKLSESSVKVFEDSHASTSPISKDTETEKRQTASNFNEHQEELDYEENEGDDGEEKSEEAVKPEKKDAKQAGEQGETGNSDKDEGELSDDDCEEGEIKEPGSKKPFVKPMCRFFQRGNCTWGINCRFLHPGINDKGNYQMIEIPGFKPVGVRSRIGTQGTWPEQPEEQIELPPPPVPDVPPVETAWERGLRIAKEQRKKASERKELESDFEDKRLNLSVDEERELNKENERMPKIIPKDPYYDPPEEDNYYQISRNPWQTGHYENFEVKYNRENSFSPSYREKPPMMLPPPPRFSQPYSPPVDKFGRDRVDRREPFRPEVPPAALEYPSAIKRPDEWTDPWRRSKSPQNPTKRKVRSRSRGRRTRRSVSDSSNSSRSSSGSSSGSSRSSRTFNSSTGSSSRSRSPEPAPPGVDRHDRYISPSREPPRSAVSIRGSGAYNNYDQNYRRMNRGYDHNRGGNNYNQRGGNRGNSGGFYNNNSNYGAMGGGPAGGYPERDMRERVRDDRIGRNNRGRSPPDRPLPYVRLVFNIT